MMQGESDRRSSAVRAPLSCGVLLLLLAGCASRPLPELERPAPSWELTFDYPIAYHQIVADQLIVVGTERHLYGIDPRTGARLWRLRNVNTSPRDVQNVPGEPYVLVQDAAGGAFDDRSTHVLAVNRTDGRVHWESEPLAGRALHALIDRDSGRLYLVTVVQPHGDDRGLLADLLPGKGLMSGLEREPTLTALDLGDGSRLWQKPLAAEIALRPATRRGVGGSGAVQGVRVFDLGIYHPPFLADHFLCTTYTGLTCRDRRSGHVAWSSAFEVVDDELGRAYPDPVVTGRTIYTADTDEVFAFDLATGGQRWDSADLGRIPELIDDDNILFAQIGGRYFDLDAEKWVARGRFGVAAINKRNGRVLWDYGRVRRSITNLLLIEGRVWFADDEHLFALDRLDGTVYVRAPHRLAEAPTFLARNDAGQLVLVTEREVAGYAAQDGTIRWYHDHPPLEPGAWQQLAAGLLSASGSLLKFGSVVVDYAGSAIDVPRIRVGGDRDVSGRGLLERTTGSLGETFTGAAAQLGAVFGFANLSGNTQYFLTRAEGHDEVVLAAVDIQTGTRQQLTVLPAQNPALLIDEINGHVVQAIGDRLVAVPLRDGRPGRPPEAE